MEDLSTRIVAETYRHLLTKGIACTQLAKVAAALRISKKTIYKHFPTKEVLLRAVFRWYQRRTKAQHRLFGATATALAELGLLLRWFQTQYRPGFLSDMRRAAPELYQAWQQYLVALIDRNLRRGCAEGTYRRPLDTPVLSRLYVGQVGLLAQQQSDMGSFPPARLHGTLGEHFLRSIITPSLSGSLPLFLGKS